MSNFREKKGYVPKFLGIKINKDVTARGANAAALNTAKKRIYWQAGLAMITIVLTIVIAFAMTSAWYTNIVQTSGLVFEAEAWGFQGNITVNEETIVAGPGDDGLIYLTVANENESIIDVGVNVSKARMSEDMQQRLFFYVDTQYARNEEIMDRVYLNNQQGYNYTIFSNGSLNLQEDMHNDAQLKWHWVYDVLGYYVYGKEIKNGEEVVNVEISEYLRPIEYDYDAATTTFKTDEEDNQILILDTVDGETTVDEFIEELSKTDGYKGTIDPDEKLDCGFYPVAVKEDEEGNRSGVYAYLCSYGEIELATQKDTEMGIAAAEGESKETYIAQLMVSAQKSQNHAVNVTTLSGLQEAINLGSVDVIQLSGDITVPADQSLTIAKDQKVMVDLNGHTIVSANAENAILVEEGGGLTMINGTLDGTDAETANGIYAVGAEVLLNNVTMTGFDMGMRIADEEGESSLDSKVRLVHCTMEDVDYGVFVKGNGTDSEQMTQLILEDCSIKCNAIGICGNGNENTQGTDIQLINTVIEGAKDQITAGIYHPQMNSKLTVYHCTITAYTGMAIKGGSVSVIDSKITGTGTPSEPMFQGSGFTDTGDAIYIETNYEGDILLEIDGGTYSSAKANSLRVYKPEAPNVTVRIYSGTFQEVQPEQYIAEGSEQNGTTISVKS